MSIAQLLLSEAYPHSKEGDRLMDFLDQEILPSLTPTYPAIQVIGSYAKGYATKGSDVEFKLYALSTHTERELCLQPARVKYEYIQRRLREADFEPCMTGSHNNDHHIVFLDKISPSTLRPLPFLSKGVYELLAYYDLSWLSNNIRRAGEIADVFTPGFVELPAMDAWRKILIEGVIENPQSERLWQVVDAIYRGNTSRVSLERWKISKKDAAAIQQARLAKFGLPSRYDLLEKYVPAQAQ